MNKTLKAVCLSVLSGICISGLAGAEIFVSPNGRDSSSGTKNAPLKTIGKAVAKAKPGDTVRLLPGIFSEQVVLKKSGRKGAFITISGTRGKNGEYLSIVQAPGKVLRNWTPAP